MLADKLDFVSIRVVYIHSTAGKNRMLPAPGLIARTAQELLLFIENRLRQFEGQMVKLIALGPRCHLRRHWHQHDHLGNASGALTCFEKDIRQLGR